MVAKRTDGQIQWLFPSSFQYLLDHQQDDGGWQEGSSDLDGILHSLAALLAVCKHINRPYQMKEDLEDLELRKSRGTYFLETRFADWESELSERHCPLRPLAAKLLQMLRGEGVGFSFRGKDSTLPHLNETPTAQKGKDHKNILPESQSSYTESPFRGQHKAYGSIMASPASTADYLIHCSDWDSEAEAYLNHIVSDGDSNDASNDAGGVPAKFPTTTFEIAGVLTALLENGFGPEMLGFDTVTRLVKALDGYMQLGSGVVGFAPHVEPDAANTAKTISALSLLGQDPSPQGLIVRYEARDYFKTYTQDRSPSFVTNCHVLKALLDLLPKDGAQMPQIAKTIEYICNYWWTTNGQIEDPSVRYQRHLYEHIADGQYQNTSALYPIMLMAGTFMHLIALWEHGFVRYLDDPAVRDKVFISLFQALIRVLQAQNQDGSWEHGNSEATAYAIISLSNLMSLSSNPKLELKVAQAIESGRNFLQNRTLAFPEPNRVWKGTITSGNSAIHQAYILAALQVPLSAQKLSQTIESQFNIPLARMTIQAKYYARQAWSVDFPEWLVQASLIENYLFLPQLQSIRYAVFPSDSILEDNYFGSIPYAWLVASNLHNRFIGAEFLYQMMILSLLTRQLEDYMDHIVGPSFVGCLFEVEDLIVGIVQEIDNEDKDQCFCANHASDMLRASTATAISDVRSVLYRFISHILNHPYILIASLNDQVNLRSKLLAFMLGLVSPLSNHQSDSSATDQSSHSYIFAFLACLVGNQSSDRGIGLRQDFFDTPEQQYLAVDVCRHLSIISFMSANSNEQQNTDFQTRSDLSSSTDSRDYHSRHRSNRSVSSASASSSVYSESISPVSPISSVSSCLSDSASGTLFSASPAPRPTRALHRPAIESLQIARLLNHERRCLNIGLQSLLEAGLNHRTYNVLRLFVDATELSEQILKDPNIGTTCENSPIEEKSNDTCILNPPPVPPKRQRGSVTAARAALSVESPIPDSRLPLVSNETETQNKNPVKPIMSPINQVQSPTMVKRDWSWNKKPSSPTKRKSRTVSEVSRIESIMSEIDGIKLEMNPKSGSNTNIQKRTASESDAIWAHPHITTETQRRLTDTPAEDPEAIKLAKVRLETQRRLKHDTRKRAATAEVAAQRRLANNLQIKAMEEIRKQDAKQRAAFPTPVQGIENKETQAKKLHRISRLGGPKWKAPF